MPPSVVDECAHMGELLFEMLNGKVDDCTIFTRALNWMGRDCSFCDGSHIVGTQFSPHAHRDTHAVDEPGGEHTHEHERLQHPCGRLLEDHRGSIAKSHHVGAQGTDDGGDGLRGGEGGSRGEKRWGGRREEGKGGGTGGGGRVGREARRERRQRRPRRGLMAEEG